MQLTSKQLEVATNLDNWAIKNGFDKNSRIAILGNAFAESGLKLNNVENVHEGKVGNDIEYTARVNSGEYDKQKFSRDSVGYGLFQWTWWSRKETMYNCMIELSGNIDSWEVAEKMLDIELTRYRDSINNKTLFEASEIMVKGFLKPYDQSDKVITTRANYGVQIMEILESCANTTKNLKIYEDENIIIYKKRGEN